MDLLHTRCAGLDVHSRSVVACARTIDEHGKVTEEVRTFDTTTKGLLELSDWLQGLGVDHVAMEATGVYWRPVWHVLDESFHLTLANAWHVKNVPGRKTDVNDAVWIADLLAHGLIRGSFVPPTEVQDLRALLRTRKQLVRELARNTQRIQKTLEDANIKLTTVVTDILGMSGRAILDALVAGETDPARLAALKHRRLVATTEQLIEALRGNVRAHHRLLIRLHLEQIDGLRRAIAELEAQADKDLEPHRAQVARLMTIPGVSEVSARVIISEIGTDLSRFKGAPSLISWAGLCPRADESAGKRRSTRIKPGASWLKSTLVQCAWGAIRTKNSYLRTLYHRLKARRGTMKAIIAVAASMLTSTYHMLRSKQDYRDLTPAHLERRDTDKTARRLIKRLADLGFKVAIAPAA